MTVQLFDHYTNQEHESAEVFISNWGKEPWNDMNVPIYLGLEEVNGDRQATVVVYHPRKHHIKDVVIHIKSDEDLALLRKTFLGIGERLFEEAAYNLEAFAKGGMIAENYGEWGGLVLYYWEKKEFKSE